MAPKSRSKGKRKSSRGPKRAKKASQGKRKSSRATKSKKASSAKKAVQKPICYKIGGAMKMFWWYNVPEELQSYKGVYKPSKIDVKYSGRTAKAKKCIAGMKREKAMIQRQGLWTQRKAGYFWGYHETRNFCRNKYWLKDEFFRVGQFRAAVKEAEELISFIGNDNMGVRNDLPYLYLLAGDDASLQKCFDFICFWADEYAERWYGWDEAVQGRDMETGEPEIGDYGNLHHAVCMTILKFRLYNRDRSNVSLEQQAEMYYKRAAALNPHVWKFAVGHKNALANGLPASYSRGSESEARMATDYMVPIYLTEPGLREFLLGKQ